MERDTPVATHHLQEAVLRGRRGQKIPMIHLASVAADSAVRMSAELAVNRVSFLLCPQTHLVRRPRTSDSAVRLQPAEPSASRCAAAPGVFSPFACVRALINAP